MLTREQILSSKPKRHVIEVPEWQGTVTIQALTMAGAHVFLDQRDQGADGIVNIVIASVINEDGTPMFSPEDKPELKRLAFSACQRISQASIDFNGLSTKAVEEQVKNSEPGLNGDSSSA